MYIFGFVDVVCDEEFVVVSVFGLGVVVFCLGFGVGNVIVFGVEIGLCGGYCCGWCGGW